MSSPIFIIGNPRSGTTLLRLMLTCHKNIVVPPECGFAAWLYSKYEHWSSDSGLEEFIYDLFHCRKIENWNLEEKDLSDFLGKKQPSSYPELASLVYERYGLLQGRPFKRWGDKNNFYVDYIPTIKAMFPNVNFVHIVRDGRDVACSYKKLKEKKFESPYQPRLPGDIEGIAEQWKANIRTIVGSFTAMGWENVYEIRFESLRLIVETSLRRLCQQLGEEYDPSMLDYRHRELIPEEFLPWKEKTLQPFILSEIGRHRNELSQEEIATFERIAGKELAYYGYD